MKQLITIFSLLLIAYPIYAQERITVWAERFPPYGYEDASGKIVGLSTEIVQYIIVYSGIRVDKWTIAPWARAYKEAQKKPNTVLYTVVGSSKRRETFHLVGPISDRNQYFYRLKSRKDIVVNSIEDAKKYQIGSVYGTAVTDLMISKGLKPHRVTNHDQTIKMLLKGRLDLAIHLDYSFAYIVNSIGEDMSTFEAVFLFDSSEKYYIAINKDSSPLIVDKFLKSFKKLVDEGGLSKIQQRYLR